MQINSALIGVVIGSVLSLLGNFLTHWFSMRKEEKQWERGQKSEEKRQKREDAKRKIESIRNTYHNCISRLSLIIASKSDKIKISDEAQINLNQEAFEWLSLLSLHQRSLYEKKEYNFHNKFQDFTEDPQFWADSLLQEVYKLAMTDRTLFPDVEPTEEDPDERRVQIRIDDNFRRKQILEGIELPKNYIYYCYLSKLTPSQREKLWDINEESKNIPKRFTLSLPCFNSNIKKVVLKGPGIWACKMNPFKNPPEEIFNAWELDYEKSLLQAQRDLEVNDKNSTQKNE